MPQSEFEDDRAVRNVLAKYAYSLDANDYEGVASCFTADASVSYQLMPEFPGGVVGFIRRGKAIKDRLAGTQHLIGSQTVELNGDSAICRSYVQATHFEADRFSGPSFTTGGCYHDKLVRTPDGWKIESRLFERQWLDDRDGVFAKLVAATEE